MRLFYPHVTSIISQYRESGVYCLAYFRCRRVGAIVFQQRDSVHGVSSNQYNTHTRHEQIHMLYGMMDRDAVDEGAGSIFHPRLMTLVNDE